MSDVPMEPIAIEPARPADAPAVIALIGRVFAEYGFSWDPAVEVPDLFDLDRHYGGMRGAFWVARLDGQVVGSVGVERQGQQGRPSHATLRTPFVAGLRPPPPGGVSSGLTPRLETRLGSSSKRPASCSTMAPASCSTSTMVTARR